MIQFKIICPELKGKEKKDMINAVHQLMQKYGLTELSVKQKLSEKIQVQLKAPVVNPFVKGKAKVISNAELMRNTRLPDHALYGIVGITEKAAAKRLQNWQAKNSSTVLEIGDAVKCRFPYNTNKGYRHHQQFHKDEYLWCIINEGLFTPLGTYSAKILSKPLQEDFGWAQKEEVLILRNEIENYIPKKILKNKFKIDGNDL